MTPDDIQKLIKDNDLEINYEISFPRFKKQLPTVIVLALQVLKEYGFTISITIDKK